MKPADHFPRLLDDPGLEASELGQALRGLSGRLPGAERLASIAAAVGAAPPAVASSGLPVLKLAMAAGALVVAGGAVLAWLSSTPPATETRDAVRPPSEAVLSHAVPAPKSAPPEAATPARDRPSTAHDPSVPEARSTPSSEVTPSPSAVEPTVPAEPNTPSASRATPTKPAPSLASPPARPRSNEPSDARPQSGSPIPPPAAPASEAEILRDARLTLEQSPQIALSLTEQHRTDYPGGKFSQEREIIAITALVRLGRSGDASARAARFRKAYPTSPYNARLDRLVPP